MSTPNEFDGGSWSHRILLKLKNAVFVAWSWKKWLPSQPTSSHWYSPENLERLIAAMIQLDLKRGEDRTV
jgi:hypothetical protein